MIAIPLFSLVKLSDVVEYAVDRGFLNSADYKIIMDRIHESLADNCPEKSTIWSLNDRLTLTKSSFNKRLIEIMLKVSFKFFLQ